MLFMGLLWLQKAIYELNREYKGSGKSLIGIGSIHGGEYANIIADHVVMKGNIRACKEEDYRRLQKSLKDILKKTEEETGTEIVVREPKPPVFPFSNDVLLTEAVKKSWKKSYLKSVSGQRAKRNFFFPEIMPIGIFRR